MVDVILMNDSIEIVITELSYNGVVVELIYNGKVILKRHCMTLSDANVTVTGLTESLGEGHQGIVVRRQ